MNDTGRLMEEVGERGPFPDDAFERMLRRRDRKQRNQRLAAAGVGIAVVVVAVAALVLASRDRTPPVPLGPPETGMVTFLFRPSHMVAVNGESIETTSDHPKAPPGTPEHELDMRYVLDPVIEVPAGARIEVGPETSRAWVDVHDLSVPAQRLYELDLADSPRVPEEPGRYYLEFAVGTFAEGGPLTILAPIRVVAPDA